MQAYSREEKNEQKLDDMGTIRVPRLQQDQKAMAPSLKYESDISVHTSDQSMSSSFVSSESASVQGKQSH